MRARGILCDERTSTLGCRDVIALASSEFLPKSMAHRICTGHVRLFDVSCAGVTSAHIEVLTCNGGAPSQPFLSVLMVSVAFLEDMIGACPCSDGTRVLLLAGEPRTEKTGGGPLLIDHINSGFSYSVRDRSHVVVFRCAEAHRTLVHELMHVWGIHGKEVHCAQTMAMRHLGSPRGTLLSEAFVEAVTWLLMRGLSPSTTDAEEISHSLTLARQFTACACDDGTTNAWSYIVGKALLISDGGQRLCKFLASGGGGKSSLRTLHDKSSYLALVRMMCENAAELPQHRGSFFKDAMPLIRMVKNDWGGAFE